jgi:hypothetical protein
MSASWFGAYSKELDVEDDELLLWVKSPEYQFKLKEALSKLRDPVEIALTRAVLRNWGNVERETLVVEYGRPFVGIARPKGYRQWARKQCFRNAGALADRRQGTYCEGFVLTPPHYSMCIHHAWITLDGKSAIDVTFPNATECRYFGIPFSDSVFARIHSLLCLERRMWPVYLGLPLDQRVIAALKEMRAGGLL